MNIDSSQIIIQPAARDDAEGIAELLLPYSQKHIVLPRTPDDIRQYIENFLIAKSADGRLLGSVALRDFGNGLQEIRSLAVREDCHGAGLGSKLILAAIELGKKRQATQILALTLRPNLFSRLGFAVVSKEKFPQKVWLDCRLCKKYTACDEVAVVMAV